MEQYPLMIPFVIMSGAKHIQILHICIFRVPLREYSNLTSFSLAKLIWMSFNPANSSILNIDLTREVRLRVLSVDKEVFWKYFSTSAKGDIREIAKIQAK